MAKRRRNQQRPGTSRIGSGTSPRPTAGHSAEQMRPQSLRERLRMRQQPSAPGRRRRISRREREARQRRQLLTGMSVAGALIAIILIGFAANEYWFKPRHVVASVNGTNIRRSDYWKVRSYDLLNQAGQFQQLATFSQGDQQTQYQSLAQQALLELDEVWGSTSIDDATVAKMIEDQLFVQNLEDLGLSVSEQDIDDFIAQQFEPIGAPIYTPTPTATLIPTRAAWATETAAAQTEEAVSFEGTPEAEASPSGGEALPIASPGAQASPMVPTDAPGVQSPIAEASPETTATTQPTSSPTPNPEQARQTAAAGYESFQENAFDRTHLSQEDYERWIVRPAVAREKVRSTLEAQIGQSADQIHAAHILVSTKELADSIAQELQVPGADFEQIARDQSSDTSTAPNGGDLGWFPRGVMVEEFDETAFATEPGQISEPFQTEFGWHIVKVYEAEANRPLTDDQIQQLKTKAVQDWLEVQRAEADIESDVEPTPTPSDRSFEAPPDAPPTPTMTPTSMASPAAGSVGSPVAQ